MRTPLTQIDPVLIMLDSVATHGELRFSGIDLEDGSRVTVVIEREVTTAALRPVTHRAAPNLVLVLSVETLTATH